MYSMLTRVLFLLMACVQWNKGQVGTSTDVHYSEVVVYWVLFCQKSFISHFMTYSTRHNTTTVWIQISLC